jgi:2-oxoglutarate ferredoxin oxidoreductase subunit beta
MSETYVATKQLPFCKGCGHHSIARTTEKALESAGLAPLDVILVTDIGCHGIVDKFFLTHTVHGLHGRSPALAAGISVAIDNPKKKVIVFVGDGGATIGLTHLIGAAQRNFNMAVVVHYNMLYGMTGGQPSGLTPPGFNTTSDIQGQPTAGHDLCGMLRSVGATYVSRVVGQKDFSGTLARAFGVIGFSLVEVMELCPNYGVKFNPGLKITDIMERSGLPVMEQMAPDREVFQLESRDGLPSLLDGIPRVTPVHKSSLRSPVKIMLGGSAGGRVQSAASTFVKAAMSAGLHVTKKGRYPVTVGTGFSVAQIIVSPNPILYHGISVPDVAVIVTREGMNYCRGILGRMTGGTLYIDSELEVPATGADIVRYDFNKTAGAKSAALFALLLVLSQNEFFPLDAMRDTIGSNNDLKNKNAELITRLIDSLA